MPEILPLTNENFNDFLSLLRQRGEAPEDYYIWKYLKQPYSFFPVGFIAYIEDSPVGCIGIINKIYIDQDGQPHPATWFADWFLTKQSRGKGVGKKLMECVRNVAPYNFGIPGPSLAQKVCLGAGYKYVPGFSDSLFYLRPFICGFNRGKGSRLKKIFRGIKYFIISFSSTLIFFFKESAYFSKYEDPKKLTNDILKFCSITLNTFLSTEDFISWICAMPAKANSKRYWWIINGNGYYCWGFTENDFWGLKKAQILDFVSTKNIEDYFCEICKTLKKQRIDSVRFVIRDKKRMFMLQSLNHCHFFILAKNCIQVFMLQALTKKVHGVNSPSYDGQRA